MIKHVMIVGYGIMGQGIALSFVRGDHRVTVLSRDPSSIGAIPKEIKIAVNVFLNQSARYKDMLEKATIAIIEKPIVKI